MLTRLWRCIKPEGLFWHSFLMLAVLIAVSAVIWYQTFRVIERTPRAYQLAQQIVSIVNVTRAALVHAQPAHRLDLISELLANEGIRIYPLEDDDLTRQFPNNALSRLIAQRIHEKLGPETRIASSVNGKPGIWVSFRIDDDTYWAFMERGRLTRVYGQQWFGWGLGAVVLCLAGAALLVRLVNRPLTRLAAAAHALANGQSPDRIPETGPKEIRAVNANFNRMSQELKRLEDDRALMLAGISHDLRTPLARLRLEVEMSGLPEDTKQAIEGDVEQMDRIIGQFMDYGRSTAFSRVSAPCALAPLLEDIAAYPLWADCRLDIAIESQPMVMADATDVRRVIINLIQNAARYGRIGDAPAHIAIRLHTQDGQAYITLRDWGPGIENADRLMRPFVRGEAARSNIGGAGLGLAIVNRIMQNANGRFSLKNADGPGAIAEVCWPCVAPSRALAITPVEKSN